MPWGAQDFVKDLLFDRRKPIIDTSLFCKYQLCSTLKRQWVAYGVGLAILNYNCGGFDEKMSSRRLLAGPGR